jgi:hypothetical protein
MLARHGIHHARVEIGWGSFDYDREDQLKDLSIAPKLVALRDHGIRPLILLNANSGAPCPMRILRKTIVRNAKRGDRMLALDSVDGLTPGYSGLPHIGEDYGTARVLIVALNGGIATLSKPLPLALAAGTSLDLVTLKYRPFSNPDGPEFAATMRGWQTYAMNVARVVRADLGTTSLPDGGFDLEIWNELTFGSEFLSINNYYSPSLETNPDSKVWGLIVAATAASAESRPDLFSGVLIGDGFASTIPWPASATEPARIDAIDKHPYAPQRTFPADERPGAHLNAAMQPDDYVPTYRANFPEYYATAIQPETIVRDMGPIHDSVYGILHGRNARFVEGRRSPVPIWITEVNTAPVEADPAISAAAAMAIKAKTTARYFTFFLNKGVTQLDLYAASDRDTGLGIVTDDFLRYADRAAAPYPADDAPFLSPALRITGRIVAIMEDGLDRNLSHLRPLRVNALAAADDRIIFAGDGTVLHPDLRAVDVFAFLPFQANAHRFVIPYYVMTRDVMKAWPEDSFDVTVAGFSSTARFSAYDPLNNKTTGVTGHTVPKGIRLRLRAADYPKLLIVNENR